MDNTNALSPPPSHRAMGGIYWPRVMRFQQFTNDENVQKGARREERQNDD
jgi:hypothetical protein